uniref:ADP,ATP carrier protein n=1 Tax=Hanusia phi TaxID=3032 RepID=A0A7S0F397_9CRYP
MSPGLMRRRIPAIQYGGPLWALVFALSWLDWGDEGQKGSLLSAVHFTLALFAYDGLLTLVELNHGALLADISSSVEDRTRLNQAAAIGAVIGSCSSFFGHMYWNPVPGADLHLFRRFSAVVSFISALAFAYSAHGIARHEKSLGLQEKLDETSSEVHHKASTRKSVAVVMRQLWNHKNLGVFTLVSALQVFECTFEKNFLSSFVDVLLVDLSRKTRSLIISTSFILPWLTTILVGPFVNKHGVHRLLQIAFSLKLTLSMIALCVGYKHQIFIGLFAVATRVLTECVCRQSPMVLADLADEDKYLHIRDKSMSATVMGTNALFTKPGESLAPMLGWAILNYRSTDAKGIGQGQGQQATLFYCLVLGPLLVASAQLVLWQSFKLRGEYLGKVKDFINQKDLEVALSTGASVFPSHKET